MELIGLSVEEWIKNMRNISTVKYYSALIAKKMLPFMITSMKLEDIMLSEIGHSQKRQHDLTYM